MGFPWNCGQEELLQAGPREECVRGICLRSMASSPASKESVGTGLHAGDICYRGAAQGTLTAVIYERTRILVVFGSLAYVRGLPQVILRCCRTLSRYLGTILNFSVLQGRRIRAVRTAVWEGRGGDSPGSPRVY